MPRRRANRLDDTRVLDARPDDVIVDQLCAKPIEIFLRLSAEIRRPAGPGGEQQAEGDERSKCHSQNAVRNEESNRCFDEPV